MLPRPLILDLPLPRGLTRPDSILIISRAGQGLLQVTPRDEMGWDGMGRDGIGWERGKRLLPRTTLPEYSRIPCYTKWDTRKRSSIQALEVRSYMSIASLPRPIAMVYELSTGGY